MNLAKTLQAFDRDGIQLERGDVVEILKNQSDHHWLKAGNTLRVSHWENRPLGHGRYMVVFLESKNGSRLCHRGLHEKSLRKVSGN